MKHNAKVQARSRGEDASRCSVANSDGRVLETEPGEVDRRDGSGVADAGALVPPNAYHKACEFHAYDRSAA